MLEIENQAFALEKQVCVCEVLPLIINFSQMCFSYVMALGFSSYYRSLLLTI